MTFSRILFYVVTLFQNLFSVKGLSALLSSFGVLWTFINLADYFHLALQSNLQKAGWWFFVVGLLGAVWICRPTLTVSEKLKGRDVVVQIAIGNMFSFDGAIVVGTNSTFDTEISRRLISGKSIQGQFTSKYYGDYTSLETELDGALSVSGIMPEPLSGPRAGKTKRYPLGTVVRVNPKNRTGYFLAITHINDHGVAGDTSFEDLKQSLGKLWLFIGQQGLKEPVAMPVLGSGFARLAQPRQVIVQEIIKSFIAACAEKTFCDKLTIVLAANDVRRHQVDFKALREYLHHVCTYTEFAVDTGDRVGTPVE
ncbi:MAG: DUF6430 domain-containing protein [Acidobacteriia bacterium]|nr:DUF6430 domain-containing protein [Terriglobia bacterium]